MTSGTSFWRVQKSPPNRGLKIVVVQWCFSALVLVQQTTAAQLRSGKGMRKIARELGVGTGTVQRVRQEMEGPFAVVAA